MFSLMIKIYLWALIYNERMDGNIVYYPNNYKFNKLTFFIKHPV